MCIDSLTPVDGTDIRMLRTLSAGGVAHAAIAEGEGMNNNGSFDVPTSNYIISPFSAVTFLKKWLVAEDTEESVWESFRESADIHVNTALPYDLSILKVRLGNASEARLRRCDSSYHDTYIGRRYTSGEPRVKTASSTSPS